MAYSKPPFIPDGYIDALGALEIAGEALFGDEWTGAKARRQVRPLPRPVSSRRIPPGSDLATEGRSRDTEEWVAAIRAKSAKEKQQENAARMRLCQIFYAGTITAEVITASGTCHPVRQDHWGGETAQQIFDRGTTEFPTLRGQWAVTIKGHVLVPEQELRDTLNTRTTTINAERRCREWLVAKMSNNSRPEKNKPEYQSEAEALFSIGSKAFSRAWADAVADTGNTEWGKPGPKSIPPDQNPN